MIRLTRNLGASITNVDAKRSAILAMSFSAAGFVTMKCTINKSQTPRKITNLIGSTLLRSDAIAASWCNHQNKIVKAAKLSLHLIFVAFVICSITKQMRKKCSTVTSVAFVELVEKTNHSIAILVNVAFRCLIKKITSALLVS